MEIEILMEAESIPDCTKVTKPTGSKEYTFRKEIIVYYEDRSKEPAKLIGNFIVSDDGNINQVAEDSKFKITMEIQEAIDFLNGFMDDECK